MSDYEAADLFLTKAHQDLKALTGMLDPDIFSDEIFGFHAQQAIEKALKAWIAILGIQSPKYHDLAQLLELLKDNGQDVESLWELVEFNVFAVFYRYAEKEIVPPLFKRPDVIKTIEALINHVDLFIKDYS
jgi:HEPN domain-containing protein